MTEIMPFPENNILFYWAAPQVAFCFYFISFLERAPLRQVKLRLCGGNSPFIWATLAVGGISLPGERGRHFSLAPTYFPSGLAPS